MNLIRIEQQYFSWNSYVSLPMGRAWISTTRMVENIAKKCEISIAKHCRDIQFFTITIYYLLDLITLYKIWPPKLTDYDCARAGYCTRPSHAHAMPIPCARGVHKSAKYPRNTFSRANAETIFVQQNNLGKLLQLSLIFRRDIVNSLWAPAKTFCTFW